MKYKQGNHQKKAMKLKAGSLKRSTKLIDFQPDSYRRKKMYRAHINRIRN